MSANKKTFEVDRFLTRTLLLRNQDNSAPSANLALLTDGTGGTYYTYLASSNLNVNSFNKIYLPDTQSSLTADLSFNILNFKQGSGVQIQKQNANTIVFKTTPIVPSTFFKVETPVGFVYAENISASLKFVNDYGILFDVSDNILSIGSYPSFTSFDVYTGPNTYSTIQADPEFSTLQLKAGFGITLAVPESNVIRIGASFSTFALNEIRTPDGLVTRFPCTFNTLNVQQIGNINITQANSNTHLYETHSFSSIVTPVGVINARDSDEILVLKKGWGIGYQITSDMALTLAVNVVSSFNFISTYKGVIDTPYSTNILTLEKGYGIDLDIEDQTVTIKMASTYLRTISTNAGPVTADEDSVVNFREGEDIRYSISSADLYIEALCWNRVDISGGPSMFPVNPFNSTINKTITINQGRGMSIIADDYTNTITFENLSAATAQGPLYAYSFVTLYSSCSYINEDVSDFLAFTLNAAYMSEATLSFVGVMPLKVVPEEYESDKRLIYVGVDVSTLLLDINIEVSTLASTLSTVTKHIYDDFEIVFSSISTQYGYINDFDVSTLWILGGLTLFTDEIDNNTMLTIAKISTNFTEVGTLNVSTIGTSINSTPLLIFDYVDNRVGINLLTGQLPQETLEVRGVILADTYLTYSDTKTES